MSKNSACHKLPCIHVKDADTGKTVHLFSP